MFLFKMLFSGEFWTLSQKCNLFNGVYYAHTHMRTYTTPFTNGIKGLMELNRVTISVGDPE